MPEVHNIAKQERYKRQYGDPVPVYNAFLMPYNKENNKFGISDYYGNIGEATSNWKHNQIPYERVQGIVVDIRFLMHNYHGTTQSKIMKMAEAIDKALNENAIVD